MPNLRIVTKNALRQAASLTASSTAGNLAVSSLAAAVKSSLHRFTSTNGSYRATWAAPARIGCVALPFCNWSPTAKQRVRVSKEKSVTNLLTKSEGNFASLSKGGAVSPAGDAKDLLNWIKFDTSASGSYAYRDIDQMLAVGTIATLSFFIVMDDGLPPVIGNNSTNGDFSIVCNSDAVNASNTTVQNLGGGLYRVFKVATTGRSARSYGVLKAAGQSARGFRVTGYMLVLGENFSSYYPSLDTFTSRASVGTYIGSDGLIKSAAANTPRMQYDPMNPFAPPRLLLEAAATNLLFPSRYSTAASTYYSYTAVASLIANVQAYRYECVAAGSPNMPPGGAVLPNTAGTYCVSSIVEQDITSLGPAVTRLIFYRTSGTPAALVDVRVDLTTGALAAGSTAQARVQKLAERGPNGGALYRMWVTYAHDGTTTVAAYPYPVNGSGTDQVGKRVIVHHMQLETGDIPTSPIVTTTAAATRAADVYTSAPGVRPDGYIDHWQSYDYDSGWVLACPAPAVELEGFTAAQAASAYAYGGGAYARHWLPQQLDATGLAVDIADPDNLQGYIEAACMVAGPYLTTKYNASATSVSVIDRTELSRSAAGDQLAEPGTISRKVPVDLRAMPEADRAKFLELVRNSRAHPILMSVFPEHPDLALERDFMVYGRRTKDSDIAYQFAGAYSTTLEIEEI